MDTNQPPIPWVPGLFLGGKAAGAWRWPLTSSSAEVKERVELYLYSDTSANEDFFRCFSDSANEYGFG